MKKVFVFILSLLFVSVVYSEEIPYEYTEWFDYYPEGVNEVRIESQDRYLWFKIENDEEIRTEEYYDFLEGYEKIEESKKTFYRVINSSYIILDADSNLVKDDIECRKAFCTKMSITPYNPNQEDDEPPKPPEEEIIVNPDTNDPICIYYSLLVVCFFSLLLIIYRKIYLVMSNRWK